MLACFKDCFLLVGLSWQIFNVHIKVDMFLDFLPTQANNTFHMAAAGEEVCGQGVFNNVAPLF